MVINEQLLNGLCRVRSRRCRSLYECCLCESTIWGEEWYCDHCDHGQGERAHASCVQKFWEQENGPAAKLAKALFGGSHNEGSR